MSPTLEEALSFPRTLRVTPSQGEPPSESGCRPEGVPPCSPGLGWVHFRQGLESPALVQVCGVSVVRPPGEGARAMAQRARSHPRPCGCSRRGSAGVQKGNPSLLEVGAEALTRGSALWGLCVLGARTPT